MPSTAATRKRFSFEMHGSTFVVSYVPNTRFYLYENQDGAWVMIFGFRFGLLRPPIREMEIVRESPLGDRYEGVIELVVRLVFAETETPVPDDFTPDNSYYEHAAKRL